MPKLIVSRVVSRVISSLESFSVIILAGSYRNQVIYHDWIGHSRYKTFGYCFCEVRLTIGTGPLEYISELKTSARLPFIGSSLRSFSVDLSTSRR